MIDYLAFISSESARFSQAVAAVADADPGGEDRPGAGSDSRFGSVPVPSCPGWSAADLTWHLAEVQYFWASIVEGNLSDYAQVVPLQRPPDDELVALQAEHGSRLAGLLAEHDPDEPCWSWHRDGHTVGWVLRRQAHESLIHRVDAELTAQSIGAASRTPIDEALAADGVDEILTVMLSADTLPDGLRFDPSGCSVKLITPQQSWKLSIGRVVGTDPDGEPTDQAAISLALPVTAPTVEIRASGPELDLWLWRRALLPDAAVTGDRSVADQLYELAAIE